MADKRNEVAYYLSWSSRIGEPVRARASRQDGAEWTELLELFVDEFGDRRHDLVAAVLENHLGRPPLVDEIELADEHAFRITATELDLALARGTQQELFA